MSLYTSRFSRLGVLLVSLTLLAAGCTAPAGPAEGEENPPPVSETEPPAGEEPDEPATNEDDEPSVPVGGDSVTLVSDPTSIAVLVNKQNVLPSDYVPPDLVEPNVAFIFAEQSEKRLMRAEAAAALEEMFNAAMEDGLYLAGVSGYRSYETQEWLFNYWIDVQGEELARMYSAEPGKSEHQLGLAMDISDSTGYCAADDCFAGTPEALWLEENAHKYGFIIRYPQGKESITGYYYEPWHVRYLGKELAREVYESGLTYEEFLAQ